MGLLANIGNAISSAANSVGKALGIVKTPNYGSYNTFGQLANGTYGNTGAYNAQKNTYTNTVTGKTSIGAPIGPNGQTLNQGALNTNTGFATPQTNPQLFTKAEGGTSNQVNVNPSQVTRISPQLTGLEKVANIGLKPEVAIGDLIGTGINAVAGKKVYQPQTSEQLVKTTMGKILGTATVTAGAALGIATIAEFIAGLAASSAAATALASDIPELVPVVRTAVLGEQVGTVALSEGGAAALASEIPAAAGVTSAVGAINTKVAATGISAVTNFLFKTSVGHGTIGLIILGIGLTGQGTVRKDVSDYIAKSGELALKLRAEGMNGMADELIANGRDLRDGLDLIIPYIPYLGKSIEENKIQGYIDILNAADVKYQEQVNQETQQALLEQQQLQVQQVQEQQQQEQQNQQTQQNLITQMQNMTDSEIVNSQQILNAVNDPANAGSLIVTLYNAAYKRYYANLSAAATAAQTPETTYDTPSTLNFGLLRTPGGYELVKKTADNAGSLITDQNEIANYYFGVNYSQLNGTQQQLVDMIKG